MGDLISDELLDAFAIVAPLDQVATKVIDRFDGVIDRASLSLPEGMSDESMSVVIGGLR
jgi:hypothetical protein